MAHLYIIRGVPGSGKTTFAKKMQEYGLAEYHFEADMFMVNEKGEYCFNFKLLSECHEKCFSHCADTLSAGDNCIVSNTFTRKWEMDQYIRFAENNGHVVTIIVCQGEYQNCHNVPDGKVAEMRRRFEY